MCQPETRQAYFVLKAFEKAAVFIDRDELVSEIDAVVKQHGFNSLSEVGPRPLTKLMSIAANENSIEHDQTGRFRLTEHGARQLSVFGEMVSLAELEAV